MNPKSSSGESDGAMNPNIENKMESLVGLNIKQLRWVEDRLDRASVLLWDVKAAYATRLPEKEREELDQAYEKTEELRTHFFRVLERREAALEIDHPEVD